VPTAVISAVTPQDMGTASGINYMSQRFGAVFAIAIGTAVFTRFGGYGTPHTVTAGFKPGLWACAVFALLAALTATAMSPRPKQPTHAPAAETAEASIPVEAKTR